MAVMTTAELSVLCDSIWYILPAEELNLLSPSSWQAIKKQQLNSQFQRQKPRDW